jgi:hypothetical protein
MNEPLFRVGGVYRTGYEDEEPFQILPESMQDGFYNLRGVNSGYVISGHGWRLADGRWHAELDRPESLMHLIPGELHLVNGEWLPVEEKAVTVETNGLDAMWEAFRQRHREPRAVPAIDPNAAMVARDGPSRPAPVVIQEPTKPSAHAAIAGLTQLGAVDHRLGNRFVHGD